MRTPALSTETPTAVDSAGVLPQRNGHLADAHHSHVCYYSIKRVGRRDGVGNRAPFLGHPCKGGHQGSLPPLFLYTRNAPLIHPSAWKEYSPKFELRLHGVLRSSPRVYPDRISRIWVMRSLL